MPKVSSGPNDNMDFLLPVEPQRSVPLVRLQSTYRRLAPWRSGLGRDRQHRTSPYGALARSQTLADQPRLADWIADSLPGACYAST